MWPAKMAASKIQLHLTVIASQNKKKYLARTKRPIEREPSTSIYIYTYIYRRVLGYSVYFFE